MSLPIPVIDKKKSKYILITHCDSYLGRILAIHLAEEISKHDKKKHWFVRAMCKEKTKFRKEFEKRGIEVKEVDYESQKMITEAMEGRIKTMIFNPLTDEDRLVAEAINVLDVARKKKIGYVVMVSLQLDQYGKWVVFRISFIQQYLYFWTKMIESKAMMGMPIAQTDNLETVHVKDICNCVAQAALTKKSMVWDAHVYLEKRVYDLKSVPSFTLHNITKSLLDSLKEDGGKVPDVHSVVLTEEQMRNYLQLVARGTKSKELTHLLDSASINLPPAAKPGLVQNTVYGLTRLLFTQTREEDDPNWCPYPDDLTPFRIQLIMSHFQLARNPQWMPVVGSPTDIRDITGRDPIAISKFFMNNRRRFRGNNLI
ncbi:hypothetical protein G6F16_009961 [Rhizopus arrhizus]|nr:hypothetical protein G6F21_008672 [Rhizopus arrhizus]KAG0812891.1 hypothetical protein G6F20_005989 [Rhizopus arrhizus]KAG0826466.1 hypothetical protein G6F18_009943 [Rhizopus arrhizus]KAG0827025.1 hypothetical protein G6F19_009007 [Rhizopus arrhizus]KAG0851077.1 hypothetical protein G6F17_009315 [Rhizopus arrhizus]